MAKKYEELTFHDDFMFCRILEDKPALCRELLELILDHKVGELTGVNPQKLRNLWLENPQIELGDETEKIFLCAEGTAADCSFS